MKNLLQKIIQGYKISHAETLQIAEKQTTKILTQAADNIRKHFQQNNFDSCSIINAKSGLCTENCKWCSQSRFHKANVEIYPIVDANVAVDMAKHNAAQGIRRFSLVTSGRALSDAEIDKCFDVYREIRMQVPQIYLCASMGLIDREKLQKLYDAGVKRYHCNIETAPSFFPKLCTTHSLEEKIKTINEAKNVGMEICSGGIIGMGETEQQRVEMAIFLRDLGVDSVPINVLNPIAGTKLEGQKPLSDDEILRAIAIFRIVMPDKHIRLAGGRAIYNHITRAALNAGASGAIMGDMLTTIGAGIEDDKKLIASLGLQM